MDLFGSVFSQALGKALAPLGSYRKNQTYQPQDAPLEAGEKFQK
jgi:hypothetical protein